MLDSVGKRLEQEKEARILVIESIEKNPRGISITGIVNHTNINRNRIRTAISYLKGSGKIEEETASMAKLYYLTDNE